MMGRLPPALLPLALLFAGCASNPGPQATTAPESGAGLVPAAYAESDPGPPPVCEPTKRDRRLVLDAGCLNRVDRSPTAGRKIDIGLGRKEIHRDLCDNMVLPSCRRKY